MRLTRIAAPVLIVALVVSGCADSSRTTSGSAATNSTKAGQAVPAAALRTLLLTEAANFGDRAPHALQGVATTRQAALALTDPGETASTSGVDNATLRVYLLEATGAFDGGHGEKLPSGAHPHGGSTLSLIVDSTTMSVLDVGLTDARDDLHALGAVFQL